MMSCINQQRMLLAVGVVLCVAIYSAGAKALPEEETIGYAAPPRHQLDPYGNHLVDDDGSLDAALINYLFAKQMVDRIKANADVTDLQRKRSYWKQCAFNAVSCFGRKRK